MKSRSISAIGVLCFTMAAAPAMAGPYADTVNSFAGGTGFGVVDQSGGSYTGTAGSGVFDPLAITLGLDGAMLALGGETGTPGRVVVSFSTGAVIDGPGADLRTFDTFVWSEGISLEASADGVTFVPMGAFGGNVNNTSCSLGTPCASDFDLAPTGLAAASFFRLTVVQGNLSTGGGCVSAFPECYDLDAVEALNFRAAPVPLPGVLQLSLLGLGLLGARRLSRK